ncbi:MAG: hypothetical protein ACQSGP_22745 [Frankia sp.]
MQDVDGSIDPRIGPGPLSSLWRYRFLSLGIVVACAYAGAMVAVLRPATPTAVARMGLSNPRNLSLFLGGSSSSADLGRYAAAQVRFIQGASVMGAATAALGRGLTVPQLEDAVTVAASSTADVVTITATGPDSATAVRRADSVVAAYQRLTLAQTRSAVSRELAAVAVERAGLTAQLNAARSDSTVDRASIESATNALNQLQQTANQAQTEAALFGSGTGFVDAASARPRSSAPVAMARDGALGTLIGLVLGGALAWIRAGRRLEVQTAAEAASLMGASLLGEIPTVPSRSRVEGLEDPTRTPREAFHSVAGVLSAATPRGVFVLVSPGRDDGRTTTTLGLASALAMAGARVAVVDADLRTARMTRLFQLAEDTAGVAEMARGEVDPLEVTFAVPSAAGGVSSGVTGGALSVLGAGRPGGEPAGLLRARATADALRRLRSTFDVVLVDTPATGSAADALALAREATGMIVTVRRRTPSRPLRELRRQIAASGAPLTGVVLTFGVARPGDYRPRDGFVPAARDGAGPRVSGRSVRSVGSAVTSRAGRVAGSGHGSGSGPRGVFGQAGIARTAR